MTSFFQRHPRSCLIGTYVLVLSLFLTYYCWQLTRDNQKVFVFVYEPNGGCFVDLSMAFLHGQVSLLGYPDPRFANNKNPYIEAERDDTPYLYDLSYYRAPGEKLGRYYVYFQPGPVLLFYLPQYFLTGQLPSQRWVMFLLSSISILLYSLLLRLLVRNYFPKVPISLEVLLMFMFGLCNMNNFLQVNSNVYQMEISFATTFTLACFLFLFLALVSKAWRILWLGLASLCAGLAFGGRPTCVFLNIVLVLMWIFLLWKEYKLAVSWVFIVESIALFLPSLLCCAASAWYNYTRFGNIFEFGVAYQLNGGEYGRYKHFLLSYIPDSIWCYFLQPGNFGPRFPFVDTECYNHTELLWKGRFRLPCSGIFPALPITLLAFAWPFYTKAQIPAKREHILFFGLLLSLWALIITTLTCMFFSVIHHYVVEPLFSLILMTTFTLLVRRQAGPFFLWEKIVLFLLFTYSYYFGIVYGLTGDTHWIQVKLHNLYGWY